jgi:cyclopropane fatty-acyl-phospholipid synthase-like methyltransferase
VKKLRKKPWWETLFGDDFSRAYRPMTQTQLTREVDFILDQLQVQPGSVILDLGCGQGEICVELARRGYSVVGYDLSVFQLAMAGDNAQQAKQKINFLQGDMREMAFDQMFDAVICWDTTFGYFEEDKNQDVLRRIKNALKPNGRLLLDVMNRDFAAREAPMNHWFEGDGCVCMDDMSLDWITNRLKVKRSIILDDGRSKELQYSTRLYTLSEVGRMLHDVGFRVAAVSGDVATRGAFFGPASRRIIIQAGKP